MALWTLQILRVLFASLFIFLCFLPFTSLADEVAYFYDDAGRLVRAVKGSEGVTYEYDEVGNLLSISRGTTSQNPPTLQNITPDLLFIGFTTPVEISGQNLFTTKTITSSNSSLSFKNISATDTTVKTEITVSPNASPGPANITITTLYGSATITVTLSSSRLSFDPPRLTLKPVSTGIITVSVIPSVGRDLTIVLRSSDRSIVSSPAYLTIPSGGTASFTVNALKEGLANINSGTPNTVVLVTTESGGPAQGEQVISSDGPVSVYIDPPRGDAAVASLVSIYIEPPSGSAVAASQPVSVYLEVPPIPNATAVSLVSIYIEPAAGVATAASLPISAYIDQPRGDATVLSQSVSVKINP